MYSLPCVMLVIGINFTSKSATKDTLIVLKGNRAEGEPRSRRGVPPGGLRCCEPRSRRGVPPGGLRCCEAEVDQQLAGELAQQISSS